MNLLLLLLAMALIFGGTGFCCGGPCGSVLGLMLLLCVVGHFAVGFHTES